VIRLAIAILLLAASFLVNQQTNAQDRGVGFAPVTDQILSKPDPADWLMWRRTFDAWGYSPLNQISRSNVDQLRLVWSRALSSGWQEGTPLVYRGVMYMPNPADIIQALDAKTGKLIWQASRKWPKDLKEYFPVPEVKRNIAIFDNLIISTSGDGFVYALDAASGKLVWETMVLDYHKGAQQTSGPIIVNGKAISGRGCEPEGGPKACVITAHDAKTGRELWRTHTIPAPGEPGDNTWGDVPYEGRLHVGTWMPPSYDPELNLVYFGTSVTSPAPKFMLGGNDKTYLYHNSTLALDATTGKIAWHYQHLVDNWDMDHTFERFLVDTQVAPDHREVTWINPRLRPGERRKIVTGIPGKTGVVYTLDRRTGEFLWARPTVMQNVVSAIDGATGAVTTNPAKFFEKNGDERQICPSSHGGKEWQPGAYSPLTNSMYFPLQNTCMTVTARSAPPSLYAIGRRYEHAPNTTNIGTIQAVSAETGTITWRYEQRAAIGSLVATGGGLLFGGDLEGHFRAFDQSTGKVLWEINLGSPIAGCPITYAVGGKQYVAVTTGWSLHNQGFLTLAPELHPSDGNNLFIFALPEHR
jgi:alcohol dehydrogenase (cytochrome c)